MTRWWGGEVLGKGENLVIVHVAENPNVAHDGVGGGGRQRRRQVDDGW